MRGSRPGDTTPTPPLLFLLLSPPVAYVRSQHPVPTVGHGKDKTGKKPCPARRESCHTKWQLLELINLVLCFIFLLQRGTYMPFQQENSFLIQATFQPQSLETMIRDIPLLVGNYFKEDTLLNNQIQIWVAFLKKKKTTLIFIHLFSKQIASGEHRTALKRQLFFFVREDQRNFPCLFSTLFTECRKLQRKRERKIASHPYS